MQGAPGEKGDKGDTGADGYTPIKGTDYYTEADKTEMVNLVLESLPSETWSFELESGSVVDKMVVVKP